MTKVADKQECPECGLVIPVNEIVKDMESVIEIAERMDYGEAEVQCPVCEEWFFLQIIEEAENG